MRVRSVPYAYRGRGTGGDRIVVDGDLGDLSYTDSFTFTAWVKMRLGAWTSENKRILGSHGTVTPPRGFFINVNNSDATGKIWAGWSRSPSVIFVQVRTSLVVPPSAWVFVAVAWSGSSTPTSADLKVAAVVAGTPLTAFNEVDLELDTFTASDVTTGLFTIGARAQDNDLEWNGLLQDVQYHNEALTLEDVQKVYHHGALLPSCQSRWLGPGAAGSGATVYDEVGNRNGTIVGGGDWSTETAMQARAAAGLRAQLPDVAVPAALAFNGSTSKITLPAGVTFERTDPFTLAAWIRSSDVQVAGEIISRRLNASPFSGWGLYFRATGKLVFRLNGTLVTHAAEIESSNVFTAGVWYHVVATSDGSSGAAGLAMYVNGVAVATTINSNTLTSTMVAAATPCIGCRNNADSFFAGGICDVRVFDRELAANEVAAAYGGTWPGDSVFAHWPLDTAAATDAGPSELDGTATDVAVITGPRPATARTRAGARAT